MRRVFLVLCCGILAATLTGCVSQNIVSREFYEPTESTSTRRADGMTHGALKSEMLKSGSPDWSGNKSFNVISVGQ